MRKKERGSGECAKVNTGRKRGNLNVDAPKNATRLHVTAFNHTGVRSSCAF